MFPIYYVGVEIYFKLMKKILVLDDRKRTLFILVSSILIIYEWMNEWIYVNRMKPLFQGFSAFKNEHLFILQAYLWAKPFNSEVIESQTELGAGMTSA